MSPLALNIILTIVGAIIGAVLGFLLQETLSGSKIFNKISGHSQIAGTWDSSWGPLPAGPPGHHETLVIDRQRGDRIWGTAIVDKQPDKKWNVEGRYDGQFLQLYFYPSDKSTNKDSFDYGCYFLKRRAHGDFTGFSSGFGVDDDDPKKETIYIDYHEMRRIPPDEKAAIGH